MDPSGYTIGRQREVAPSCRDSEIMPPIETMDCCGWTKKNWENEKGEILLDEFGKTGENMYCTIICVQFSSCHSHLIVRNYTSFVKQIPQCY